MADYLEQKAIGRYFRAPSSNYVGYIRLFGSYTEYRVAEGIPEKNVMLEVFDVVSGVLLTRVNPVLFENGEGFLHVDF